MEQQHPKPKERKIRVYIIVQPYNIKFGAMFNPNQDIIAINKFISEQFSKIKIRFDIGRIESMETSAILLPGNHIGDFLREDSEVTVYSHEYGLNLKTLPGDGIDQRLPLYQKVSLLYNGEQKKFLGNKTKRNKWSNKANNNKKEEGVQQKEKPNNISDGKKDKKDEKVNDNKKETSEKQRKESKEKDKDKERKKEKNNETEHKKDKEKEKDKSKEQKDNKDKEKDRDKDKDKEKEKDKKKITQSKSTKETNKSVNSHKKYYPSDNDSD